jgi:hypothetical protein
MPAHVSTYQELTNLSQIEPLNHDYHNTSLATMDSRNCNRTSGRVPADHVRLYRIPDCVGLCHKGVKMNRRKLLKGLIAAVAAPCVPTQAAPTISLLPNPQPSSEFIEFHAMLIRDLCIATGIPQDCLKEIRASV